MQAIPYSRQNVTDEDVQAVRDALRSDFLTQGPLVPVFERAFALAHDVPHAVAVNSATAALHIACLALGVGPGSRVWTSPNSFVASANCALYCGAVVDFVDIDPRTRNMSVFCLEAKLAAASKSGTLPTVLIPVDFSGLPCDMRELRRLADQYGFRILQDASHAVGARYLGKPVGSEYADAAVFSFHAVKIVTTGEGGIVTTRDEGLAHRLRLLRTHGITRDAADMQGAVEGPWYYEQCVLGFNYRMTDIQAALGLSQLSRLDAMQRERDVRAQRYDEALADLPLLLPLRLADRQSSWHLYAVEIDEARTAKDRAAVFASMRNAGIGVNVHYIPIHTQPFYARLGFKRGDFPASESYYARTMSIPLFPALTAAQQDFVVRQLKQALA